MYVPEHFEFQGRDELARFIDRHRFGLLLSASTDGLHATHVPFLLDGERLLCHLARANPHNARLAVDGAVLAVFQGPHSYISPTWYESPGVPTWNYAAVHVRGRATAVGDRALLAGSLERLAALEERALPNAWIPDYDPGMLAGVVGYEIRIESTQGKLKMSQNRSRTDRARIVERLRAQDTDAARQTAELVRRGCAKR